jgi:MYXO-CTERM domain-containing protein
MNKLNLKMLAGGLALVALPALASADGRRELGAAQGFTIAPASMTTDLAETRTIETPQGPVQVLRYNDQDQTQEMAVLKVSPDGKRMLYVHMRTAPINEGTAMQSSPVNNMQCALSVLDIGMDATTGGFTLQRPTTGPGQYDTWLTDNDGNEWRNCNRPALLTINGGQNVAFYFNYQPNGGNDTRRYAKVLAWDGTPVTIRNANGNITNQVVTEAKDNDDCGTSQDGSDGDVYYDAAGMTRVAVWGGCNGNNYDDGWLYAHQFACTGAGATADCTITRLFDISLATREERTRGRCTVGGTDRSFATCTWTEGNDQPADEGVWMAAVDLSEGGQNGENADSRLLWKDRIDYRQEMVVNGQPREYYAMRANHARLLQMQPDGSVQPSNQILYTWGLNRGGNNNDKKGGRTDYVMAAVYELTRTGYTEVMPKTNIQPLLLGLDNTHVQMQHAIFGKGDEVLPGFSLVMGDHTGGAARTSELRTIAYDPVAHTMVNLGQHDLGRSYDRHLYSNYLGNNPGNQGRNFATCELVQNPYADMPNNHVTYFQACALTGKLPEQAEAMYKTSALASLFPVAFTKLAPPPGGGWNEEDLPGEENPTQGPDEGPGSSVGGCTTSSGSNGLVFALALGLATFIRRRRR